MIYAPSQMIEYCRLNIEYLRFASSGSIIKKKTIKMKERSDIHKYSIVNLQYSIPLYPGLSFCNNQQSCINRGS